MGYHKSVIKRKERRRNRSKKTSFAHPTRLRLAIYRSIKNIEVQIIDDYKGHTIVSSSSRDKVLRSSLKGPISKTEFSKIVGKDLAAKATNKKIKSVVLDRNGYPYHGRVKAFVDSARKNGLNL